VPVFKDAFLGRSNSQMSEAESKNREALFCCCFFTCAGWLLLADVEVVQGCKSKKYLESTFFPAFQIPFANRSHPAHLKRQQQKSTFFIKEGC